jgi:hypothetical protein
MNRGINNSGRKDKIVIIRARREGIRARGGIG